MKIGYLLLSILIFTISCKNDPKPNSENPETSDTAQNESLDEVPSFEIKTQTDEQGTPHSKVSIIVGGKKLELTEVNACEKIAKEDYSKYQIPAKAIAACGGWWAGAGDYFYILDDGNKHYTVMQGSIDESGPKGAFNYTVAMKLVNKRMPKNE